MVIVKSIEPAAQIAVNSELRLASTRTLRYVAPLTVAIASAASNEKQIVPSVTCADYNIINDAWEGVNDFCEALDHIIDCERETDLLIGRSILEIGFASGIPSVFALDSGAESATIHATDPLILDAYIKPTLRRNNVSPMLCKFSTSVWSTTRTTLAGKKYDVILAPELLCVDESQFDALHEILDETLASNGVAFISARIFYPNVTASIPAFMDLLKLRGRFDAFIRWTSRKSLLAPRQLIQLSRR